MSGGGLEFMRTSEVLTRLAEGPDERLSLRDILASLGDRSFSLLIVLLGLPNCIPMPPPIPLLCSLLLIVVGVQVIVGLRAPWLPSYLLARSVARTDFDRATQKAMPYLERLGVGRLLGLRVDPEFGYRLELTEEGWRA